MMDPQLNGFSDELIVLTKEAGIAGSVGKWVAKKPLHALGVGLTVIPAVLAGITGYRRGKATGKPARYLQASRYGPSRAFWINWHRLLSRKKMPEWKRRKLHEHYHEQAMKR